MGLVDEGKAMSVTIYLAQKMSGRVRKDIVDMNLKATAYFESRGIRVLSPVLEEGVVKDGTVLIPESAAQLAQFFKRDKALIRKAHVVVDLTAPMPTSEGVFAELGYARYGVFKPVVRIYPNLGVSVARVEHDAIPYDIKTCADVVLARWGTWSKRMLWRWQEAIFFKWWKLIFYQLVSLLR